MKKRMVFIAGVIMTVFCACASQKDQMGSSNKNNSVEVTEKLNSDSKHTEKKKYTFTSYEEIENINDEDLVYIASNDYVIYDFCAEGSYHKVDLFDMEETSKKDSSEVSAECIRPIVADVEELVGFDEKGGTIPSECMTAYAKAYIADYFERQNTKEPGEETGSVVKDEESLYQQMRRMVSLPRQARIEMGNAARKKMEREFDKKMVVEKTVQAIFKE